MTDSDILIRGAREHNLQNIDLRLPRNRLICMTGVSGSGKSSLAFDTLYAEGQRRYVESLSSYARQFLGQMPKPEVDSISGLAPSISIQQKTSGRNPRSTVGTITEIYDYLRVLFARSGTGHCAKCGQPITAQTVEQIIEQIARLPEGSRFQVLAPVVQQQKGEYKDLFDDLLKQGFLRARVDGTIVPLTEKLSLDKQMRHSIEVVVDRLVAGKATRSRMAEAVESALKLTKGNLIVALEAAEGARPADAERQPDSSSERLYSAHYACTACGVSYEPPSPQLFSFNSPMGMCLECNGLGMRHDFVVERLVTDDSLSLNKGAIELLGPLRSLGKWKRHVFDGIAAAIEKDHGLKAGALVKTAWRDLSPEVHQTLWRGMGDRHITFTWKHPGGVWKHGGTFGGLVEVFLDEYRSNHNPMRRAKLERYMDFIACGSCRGTRLNPQARNVFITSSGPAYLKRNHAPALSLPGVCSLSIQAAADFFESLELDGMRQLIAAEVLKEIRGRLGFLLRCGLDYLNLDRTAPTLSGGETQRIRLAGQIGCGLVGVVYILDEPSIGLHPRDNGMLLGSLCELRDQGNTVIVVEHDEETMRAADQIVDFGPGPGVRGGEVVAQGTIEEIAGEDRSLTGKYLSGALRIERTGKPRKPGKEKIVIQGARHNNLKDIDVSFPLGTFICVTGVSGSGKSSLVNDILWELLNRDVNKGKGVPGVHKRVKGLELVDKAIDIDQSPIGRTPRSNPATYVKLYDQIRDLFTKLPDARRRGFKPGRFSFNVSGGRCEACEGHGSTRLEMDFLADVWITCPVCEGRRFTDETLEIRYKGKNVAEVLNMDVQEALSHFENIPRITRLLQTLHDVGLDYLKLGQPSPTLSGGEAQRIKLARELGKRSTGKTIYLLDEPTTGLHFADISKLLDVLHGFVDAGNTVLVVEHNLDVIKTADWIVDLGPEGGAGGGTIVFEGTPDDILACAQSHTGRALKEHLNPSWANNSGKKNGNRRSKPKQKPAGGNGHGGSIVVNGAAQHNLQSVNVEIPRDRMSVFCGPSGSGKSSLAMDTLYAEGQRRYVESLSSYARQFLGQMPKPRVEHIHGLSPAIAIEQKNLGTTPRSTVGTVTEIYDYLRILFARLGKLHCPDCLIPVETQTVDEVIAKILTVADGQKVLLLAPQEVAVGQKYDALWTRLQSQGFARVRINGETMRLEDVPEMDRRRKHQVEIVVDRLAIAKGQRSRIAGSIESAFDLGRGQISIAVCDDTREESQWLVHRYSLHYACQQCGRSFEQLTPHNFSFNSALGWCPACEGIGTQQGTNLSSLIADERRTLREGAIAAWPKPGSSPLFEKMLHAAAREFRIPLDVRYCDLDPAQQRLILFGKGDAWIDVYEGDAAPARPSRSSRKKTASSEGLLLRFQYKGLYPAIEEASRVSYVHRQKLLDLVGEVRCSACDGSRLRDDAGAVRFQRKTLKQICEMPLAESLKFLKSVKLKGADRKIAADLLHEAIGRLSFLVDVGLHYVTLSRTLPSLSGGEVQRIRLAGQIGRALTGVLYVLDEPTIGLHPRDNGRLIQALARLRDLGNTLVLVEHDREVLAAADQLYDFGPGAGRLGGTIVGAGTPQQLSNDEKSLTGEYLSGRKEIAIPAVRRMPRNRAADKKPLFPDDKGWLELLGARQHNLRDVDLRIPLGTLTCVTGVSGSGKSSLVEETLARALARRLHRAGDAPGPFEELLGLEQVNKVIVVDQQPLGNTPASNPATYTGVFEHIRELFVRLPDAKVRGYTPARFSFNRPGGRCDACEGNGQKCIEMHFLPDVWVECETCRGKRYNQETLAVKYRGQSIADVLEMPIGKAAELFENIPKIRRYLATLCAIGLDYLTLGQSAPTLSGGEAQRVKLAAELARPNTGRTFYILDEPTTGLHFDDIAKLLKVLNSLVELGNTVVVVEHNLDVIKTADWVIDLGPEAGDEGGRIVAQGTPEQVAAYAESARNGDAGNESGPTMFRSFTGEMLAPVLKAGTRQAREIFDAQAAGQKQKGDVELSQVGQDARMPWQVDGRKWHTVDRISHTGQRCEWDGQALEFVVDRLAERDGLAAPDWNSRGVVEISGEPKSHGWFLHAMTGDAWLLTLKFRVKRNTFQPDELTRRLGLAPLDDLDELPVYGRGERVRVNNLKGPWQEVLIAVHWLKEVTAPEFQEFLGEAVESFLAQVNHTQANPDDLMPWKQLGRKWHLMRKGFPSGKQVKWSAEALDELFKLLEAICPKCEVDWGSKATVVFRSGNDTWATVNTKRREGIDLLLYPPKGEVALGRIAEFGKEREIVPARDGRGAVKIRFDRADQIQAAALQEFLREQVPK